ncbi:helix-turn-helix domain-containing protein [Pseudomonas fluorescens]|uniref:helix-turn-helix domain-containing protein n=1 Tax=Pseudomonas fluorescens TaxID=294 RepID=UPI0009B8FB91|nr:helix-turn-helix domain-containing protein [Pseudomonas fluorescens]
MLLTSNSIHAASLLPAIEELITRGIPQELIEGLLRRNLCDLRTPFMRIPLFLSRQFWDFALAKTGDSMLGLPAGIRFVSTSSNGLTYLFDVATSIEKSCEYLTNYFPFFNGHFQPIIRRNENFVELQLHDCGMLRATPPMRDYAVASICKMLRRKCYASSLSEDPILAVGLTNARPPSSLVYENHFHTSVEWCQQLDTISLNQKIFSKAVTPSNAKLEKTLIALLDETRQNSEPTLLELVSDHIINDLDSANWQSFCDSSYLLERTATRRLKALGWSFSELLDEYRRYRALDLLHSSDHSLVDIACQLGYRDVQSLNRASLRWFGSTPGLFRLNSEKRVEYTAVMP